MMVRNIAVAALSLFAAIASAQSSYYSLELHPVASSVTLGGSTGTQNGESTADASLGGRSSRTASADYIVDERVYVTYTGSSVNAPTVDAGSHYYFTYYTYAGAELNFTLGSNASEGADANADGTKASVSSSGADEDYPPYDPHYVDGSASGITLALVGGVWKGWTTANESSLQAHANINNPSGLGNQSGFVDAYAKASLGSPSGPLSVTPHN